MGKNMTDCNRTAQRSSTRILSFLLVSSLWIPNLALTFRKPLGGRRHYASSFAPSLHHPQWTSKTRLATDSVSWFATSSAQSLELEDGSSSKRIFPIATRKRLPLLLLTVASFFVFPKARNWGVAGWNLVRDRLRWKRVATLFAIAFAATALLSNIETRRRQSKDATSEWQRYAEHPSARGRAIMVLMMKQSFLIAASKIAQIVGATEACASLRNRAGRKFSDGLLKLGPLYIKLGQIASCRPGLLGNEWVDSLEDLQDKVPARKGQDALDLAYAALDGGKDEFDRLFSDFQTTPLAAASLGQVHRAKLRETNKDVAIKVQRPHLRKIYDQDFKLLTTIAKWMDKLSKTGKNIGGVESSWTQIFADAESILYREIDYRDEADNAIRFASDFGLALGGVGNSTTTALARNNQTMPDAAEWLRTPYIYAKVSNERILVQEYVPSVKITDTSRLDALNVTQEDRIQLADALARAYLRQFCCNLFFSTDPHPGNLGVEMVPISSEPQPFGIPGAMPSATMRPRLVMYDFGQAATLTKSQADGILEIIEAIIDTDVDRSIEAFQKMGVLVDGADLDQVRMKVAENYRTGKIKANRKRLRQKGFRFQSGSHEGTVEERKNTVAIGSNFTNVTDTEFSDSQVMSYFTLPAEYAFVARAISQMDGVGKALDPEFDFISSAAPYIVEIKGADQYLKDEATKVLRSFEDRIRPFCDWWEKLTGN